MSKLIRERHRQCLIRSSPKGRLNQPEPDLQAQFNALEGRDGLDRYVDSADQGTLDELNELDRHYRSYLASHDAQHDQDESHEKLYLTIGFDFGSSCTKIIVKAPFSQRESSFALDVPVFFRMDDHPHLWKAVLCMDEASERFSLVPSAKSCQLTDLKTTLMDIERGHKVLCRSCGVQLTAESCCAAFIGMLLRLTKGWIWRNFPRFFGRQPYEVTIRWEANFGLPAATMDNVVLKERFASVFCAAWQISESANPINGVTLDRFRIDAERKKDDLRLIVGIRPEVVAQSIGLIMANLADFGIYALVDIGASTLDVCVFNYFDSDDHDKQALFVADVQLLGAQSPRWLERLRKDGLSNVSDGRLRRDIRCAMTKPIVVTKKRKYSAADAWNDVLPVIVAGGGKDSELHRAALGDFRKDSIKQTNAKDIRWVETVIPEGLKSACTEADYHRLSVAWGLSIRKDDFAEFQMPSEIGDDNTKVLDFSDNYVSKDDV